MALALFAASAVCRASTLPGATTMAQLKTNVESLHLDVKRRVSRRRQAAHQVCYLSGAVIVSARWRYASGLTYHRRITRARRPAYSLSMMPAGARCPQRAAIASANSTPKPIPIATAGTPTSTASASTASPSINSMALFRPDFTAMAFPAPTLFLPRLPEQKR